MKVFQKLLAPAQAITVIAILIGHVSRVAAAPTEGLTNLCNDAGTCHAPLLDSVLYPGDKGYSEEEEGLQKRGGPPINVATAANVHGFRGLEAAASGSKRGFFKTIKHYLSKPFRALKKKKTPKPARVPPPQPQSPPRNLYGGRLQSPPRPPPGGFQQPYVPTNPNQLGYQEAVDAHVPKVLAALANKP